MANLSKPDLYAQLKQQIMAVIAGETSRTARYATAVSLLAQAFSPRFYWIGFYEVDPNKADELVVGPYQGTLGCLRISFSRGVCGAAARTQKTQRIADVHAIADHIACDNASKSEIVVPVFDQAGRLCSVLDVDSCELNAFDEEDQAGLEAICADLLS